MGSSSFSGLFDVLITAFGGYILYTGILMKWKREIRGGMFLPQGIDPGKCRDKDGYIDYIGPRFLLLGVVCFLNGLFGLAVDYLGLFSENMYLIIILLFLAVLVWYGITIKKAVKKYWGL